MELSALIHRAYPSPEWAVFFEVTNSTGSRASRRADAIALGVWPSRGHAIVGFEFKTDRRDWLREKDNPAKAEVMAAHCDNWWVVAGSDDVVKVEELPEPWGLYVANKERTRLRIAKPSQPFADRDKSVMKRGFVAAMLRKVSETTIPQSVVDQRVRDAVQAAVALTSEGRELEALRRHADEHRALVEAFKAATGVDLLGWKGTTKIAAAVGAVLNIETNREILQNVQQRLQIAAKTVQEAIDNWPTLEPERRE